MVIGASTNPAKFGNKAVRAYRRQGHIVLPVNPHEPTVEGLAAYADVASPPGPIDRATLYVPPEPGRLAAEGQQPIAYTDVEQVNILQQMYRLFLALLNR